MGDRPASGRRRVATSLAFAFTALALAFASVRVQRVGAAPREWTQELCAPLPLHPCPEGVLQGGWPAAFLLDRPGISVMGKLALVEDLFRPSGLFLDWVLAYAAIEIASLSVRALRGRSPVDG